MHSLRTLACLSLSVVKISSTIVIRVEGREARLHQMPKSDLCLDVKLLQYPPVQHGTHQSSLHRTPPSGSILMDGKVVRIWAFLTVLLFSREPPVFPSLFFFGNPKGTEAVGAPVARAQVFNLQSFTTRESRANRSSSSVRKIWRARDRSSWVYLNRRRPPPPPPLKKNKMRLPFWLPLTPR